MPASVHNQIVDEAKSAFSHNANIIKEQGVWVIKDAAVGVCNVSAAYLKNYFGTKTLHS
jgi:heme oxygenase